MTFSQLKKQSTMNVFKPGISIRNFLIIPFAILITLMVAILTFLSFQKGQDAVEQIKILIRERTLQELQNRIANYMNTAHRLNEATENFISKGHLNIKNPIALQDFFWNQLKIHQDVNYIYFGYKNGGIILIARQTNGSFVVRQTNLKLGDFPASTSKVFALDTNGRRTIQIQKRQHFDSRTRPWFKKAVLEKGPIWTDIYPFFLENALGITAALPLYNDDKELLGVISTDILLTTFNKVLKLIKPTERSELFIFEKNGKLISSTSDQKPFIENGKRLKRIDASQSKSPVIRTAYQTYLASKNKATSNTSPPKRFDIIVEGQQHLVEIFPFQDKQGLDWLIGLTISEQDLIGPVQATLKLIIYFGIGGLLFSIVLCIFFGQRLTLPLLNLEEAAGNLAVGNANSLAEPSSISELNSLAHSFNAMAQKVKGYISELEQKNATLNLEIDHRHLAEKKLKHLKDEIDIKQRTQIAGELHDNIGQSLQAINLGLKMLARDNEKQDSSNIQISELVEEVGTAISQLRDIIERQRPIFLDQMDLITAIEHYGKKLSGRAGCDFQICTTVQSLDLTANIKEPIFLIFQEALNNATKYSYAKNIKVNLSYDAEKVLTMKIHDNGIGFNIDKMDNDGIGLGLSLMSERAESIGGLLTIEAIPDSGTTITMEAPLHD